MKIAYINPNSTRAMTDHVVAAAQAALPEVQVVGFTNADGPPAIEGAEDGAAAVPGVLSLLPQARAAGAEAVVIACFDDTGLAQARAQAGCPVLGIGQAAYLMAALLGLRFSVVTSVAVAVPVIEGNITQLGFAGLCASVRASGLPVLAIDEGRPETLDRLAGAIAEAHAMDGADAAILGCAGMAALKPALEDRTDVMLIDGVVASAYLARAAADFVATSKGMHHDA